MKKLSIALLFCGIFINGYSQTATKTENIKKLLELTGSGNMGAQVAQNMITSFKTSLPNVPQEFWDNCAKEMDADAIVKLVIPIYEKYYTDEDIKQINEFYQSETGKKMIKVMPMIVQESMEVGKTWGMEIGQKVMKDLKEKGYLKDK